MKNTNVQRVMAGLAFVAASWLSSIAVADEGWTLTGRLLEARTSHTATLLADGRVLVAGGSGGLALLATAEVYDPAMRAWAAVGPMTMPRIYHTATLLPDGRVLVTGGLAQAENGWWSTTSSAEVFDPATATWAATDNLTTARYLHTATALLDGTVLVAGGSYPGADGTDPAELYDPATGTWSKTAALFIPSFGHTATLLPDGAVLVVGGAADDEFYWSAGLTKLYLPAEHAWVERVLPALPRTSHTATLLATGRVLVTGGVGLLPCCPDTGRVEMFDEGNHQWSAVSELAHKRTGHSATLLPSGELLVAGGRGWMGLRMGVHLLVIGESETYSEATGQWRPTGAMNEARAGHTATLLRDGSVLVAGGQHVSRKLPENVRSVFLDSAELYQSPQDEDCKNHYILTRPCPAPN
jgi:hypothetical protein